MSNSFSSYTLCTFCLRWTLTCFSIGLYHGILKCNLSKNLNGPGLCFTTLILGWFIVLLSLCFNCPSASIVNEELRTEGARDGDFLPHASISLYEHPSLITQAKPTKIQESLREVAKATCSKR